MSNLSCQSARLSLGVLVLGTIDPEERPALEAHLAGCADCRRVLAELAILPGLLHRITPEEATAGLPATPPDFARRLREEGEAARRRSRRVTRAVAGALAAAAMVVGALLLSGVFDGSRPPATAAPVVVQGTDPTSGVHAEVTLRARSTGTQVTLALRGVRPGEHCRLVVADGVGHREVAASWVASYEGAADVTGTTGLASARITRLSVVGTGGRTLVTMPVPAQ